MKNYLKFIATLLSCFIVFTFATPNVSAQEIGHDSSVTVRELCSPDGSLFELYENADVGYWIIDKNSQTVLEGSDDAPSPYKDVQGDLLYLGPTEYYYNDSGTIIHTLTHMKLEKDQLEILSSQLRKNIKRLHPIQLSQVTQIQGESNADSLRTAAAETVYVPSSSYIRNAVYPKNIDGTCGYTAACILLNYWNKVKGGYVPSEFLDSNGNLKTTGMTLQDKLVKYGGSNDSWGRTIKGAINQLVKEYSLKGTAHYGILSWGDLSGQIRSGKPVILFGYLPSSPQPASVDKMEPMGVRGKVFHAVLGYGLKNDMYICHYGWSGYEHVLLNAGIVGSNTRFDP